MASFAGTDLVGWASMADCVRQLRRVEDYLQHDAEALEGSLRVATGMAQSWLRPRWREEWPFTTPPQEIRDAVAKLAVYDAVSGYAVEISSDSLVEGLRLRAKDARDWLKSVGAGTAELDIPTPPDGTTWDQAYVAQPPNGEFGFATQSHLGR
jgi:phage gp36-like protein